MPFAQTLLSLPESPTMHIAFDTYYIQASAIAVGIIWFLSRNRKIDLFPIIAVCAWLIGVCTIYFVYGANQVNFYSNDQYLHSLITRFYLPYEGFSFNKIVTFRYLITYPAFLLSKIGLNDILVLKSFQILSLIGIYFKSKEIIFSNGFSIKYWHFMFIASPLMFFFSLLALRDLTLALFTICFIFDRGYPRRTFYTVLIFLLKPHLAIALLFGILMLLVFKRIRTNLDLISTLVFVFFSYLLGSFSYSIGTYVKYYFFPGLPTQLLSQSKFFQISLNFSGLQFFSLLNDKNTVVATPTTFLLLARILLFDTFVIPVSFVIIAIFFLRSLRIEAFVILVSFIFYLGLVSQTDFNSTRQNIPFMAAMGIISVVNIESGLQFRRRKVDTQI
jgi:hypothetical protein